MIATTLTIITSLVGAWIGWIMPFKKSWPIAAAFCVGALNMFVTAKGW